MKPKKNFSGSLFTTLTKAIITWPFPASKKDISGEVALVTGAGSGLGRGVAYLLAEKEMFKTDIFKFLKFLSTGLNKQTGLKNSQ